MFNHVELTLACAEKKAFYNYHSALKTADDNLPGRLWNTIFGLDSEPFFSGIYARPVAKRDSDIQWRILHGALASCRRLRQMDYRETDNCPFYDLPEDILHIFVKYSRLSELSLYLMSLLKSFNSFRCIATIWRYPR